jgi:hypothetical protein
MQEKLDRYEESVHDIATYSSSNPSNQGILRLGSWCIQFNMESVWLSLHSQFQYHKFQNLHLLFKDNV